MNRFFLSSLSGTVIVTYLVSVMIASSATAFAPSLPPPPSSSSRAFIVLTPLATAKTPLDDDMGRLKAKAAALLEKSKAKLALKEANRSSATNQTKGAKKESALPFFATSVRSRDTIIKSRNAETGLVRADGERMAAFSEEEEWEARPLLEVFENEMDENGDVYSITSQQLASRDVAASIFDLRKQLQTEDYKKIFNKRHPFIGEDN